jgi:hypothetical protein
MQDANYVYKALGEHVIGNVNVFRKCAITNANMSGGFADFTVVEKQMKALFSYG